MNRQTALFVARQQAASVAMNRFREPMHCVMPFRWFTRIRQQNKQFYGVPTVNPFRSNTMPGEFNPAVTSLV